MSANSAIVHIVCSESEVEMYFPSSPTFANIGIIKGAGSEYITISAIKRLLSNGTMLNITRLTSQWRMPART